MILACDVEGCVRASQRNVKSATDEFESDHAAHRDSNHRQRTLLRPSDEIQQLLHVLGHLTSRVRSSGVLRMTHSSIIEDENRVAREIRKVFHLVRPGERRVVESHDEYESFSRLVLGPVDLCASRIGGQGREQPKWRKEG